MNAPTGTWMSDILHYITQGLLAPDIILLIAFIGYALFCIGSILVEFFTERRHFKVTMPKFLAALMAAEEDEIPAVIKESGLLKRQKLAMLTVYDYRVLPGDALVALIRRLVTEEEGRYDHITGRNNMAARVSPMLGLMGTLIPLGPGIQALGQQNTEALSTSLLIAFDTTVAGLVVAAVCMVIGKIRSIWYANYMSALDTGMATMLQKIEDMRAEGKIITEKPSDYAFLFEQEIAKQDTAAGFGKFGKLGKEGKVEGVQEPSGPNGLGSFGGVAQAGYADGPMSDAGIGANVSMEGNAKANGDFVASAVFAAPGMFPAPPAPPAASTSSATTSPIEYAPSLDDSRTAPVQPMVSEPVTQPTQPMQFDPQNGGGSVPTQSAFDSKMNSFTPAVVQADFSQQEKAADAMQPLKANASFAPVPDPPFIADLAAAASADAQSEQQVSAPTSDPVSESVQVPEPVSQPAPAPNAWYRPSE